VNIIVHRRNTVADLESTPTWCGVEVDIRSHGDQLVVEHEPFRPGEAFDSWLDAYHHGTIILNVKEEGLESFLLERMRSRGIDDFFFLDQSFPFLMKTINAGEHRTAVRVSEIESLETALALGGRVEWVWVDCFSRFPLDSHSWRRLTRAGFKLCLVSPELVGRPSVAEIVRMRTMFAEWQVEPDAVCTKLAAVSSWTRPLTDVQANTGG
jgi:hypothetical protein